MTLKQLQFVIYFLQIETLDLWIFVCLFVCRKQEQQVAKNWEIKTNERTSFSEEGEFINAPIIGQSYIRKLICLTKS